MVNAPVKILLTGPPGYGKTTAVVKIVGTLDARRIAGFCTEEIRDAGKRRGFGWRRLDGRTGILAHVDIRGPHRVGKYGVDIEGFDRDVVPVLNPGATHADLFVVDEIGKMECFSKIFVEAVRRLLDSDKCVLATVARKGGGFIREAKEHSSIRLLSLTAANRDDVAKQVAAMLAALKR